MHANPGLPPSTQPRVGDLRLAAARQADYRRRQREIMPSSRTLRPAKSSARWCDPAPTLPRPCVDPGVDAGSRCAMLEAFAVN